MKQGIGLCRIFRGLYNYHSYTDFKKNKKNFKGRNVI